MDAKKVTCWFNWDEWNSVVKDVYNNVDQDREVYKRAFYRILAWECRDGNLPAALIGLKELLIAKLYPFDARTASIDETYFYQSTLAMNIVRFVNFVTEPYQKGTFAKPIKSIANEIGLPDWVVNLRHNATHFNLPSIEILENARDFLFNWVKVNYIDTYKEIPLEGSIIENIKSLIRETFSEYISTRFKKVLLEEKKKSQKSSNDIDTKVDILTDQFKNETLEILIENGVLIPTMDQLESIGIVVEEFLENDKLSMPKPIINVWKEFLRFCNEKNLIGMLFQNLVNAYKFENGAHVIRADPLRNRLLLCWILTLLDYNITKNEKAKQLQLEFEFNPKQLLLEILSVAPNRYSLCFLNQAKKMYWMKSSISQEDIDKLISLVGFVSEDQVAVASDDEDQMNVEELRIDDNFYELFENFQSSNDFNKADAYNKKKQQVNNNRNSNWILIDDLDWNNENLKLGLIPSQTYQNFNLEINGDESNKDQTNQQENVHNLSINEAVLREVGLKQQQNINGGFSIDCLGRIQEDSMERIRQDLRKNYWGCD